MYIHESSRSGRERSESSLKRLQVPYVALYNCVILYATCLIACFT